MRIISKMIIYSSQWWLSTSPLTYSKLKVYYYIRIRNAYPSILSSFVENPKFYLPMSFTSILRTKW